MKKCTVRPLPESQIEKFGTWVTTENWKSLLPDMSSTELVESFEKITKQKVDEFFPQKTVTITAYDKPYITQELKILRRQRQRAYRKGGKSEKYLKLKNTFDAKLKKEAEKYRDKILVEVAEGKRLHSYKGLRKLEFKHEEENKAFTLPEHSEKGLTADQIAEDLAVYFSAISQEYEPVTYEKLRQSVQKKLECAADDKSKPVLEQWEVYRKIKVAKKPNSIIPGDLPVKLVKEFVPELVKPITLIYNQITETGVYPRQWVIEYQTPIPKIKNPASKDDLRNISFTAFFSKQYESFLGDWLFPYIEPFLDPGQCGGLKGSSISHYLVKLLHFVHSYLDKNEPYAVLLSLVDLEKAFNRVSHTIVIEDLADMNVPGWLLKILISYLTERSMFLKFGGALSSKKFLPGSSPQGAFLGILLFIIIFNGALLRPSIPRPRFLSLKYIDDLSVLQALKLSEVLQDDVLLRPLPLSFNERTRHVLQPIHNPLQKALFELEEFTQQKNMKIKEKKTNIMKFNFSKKFDFPPELSLKGFSGNMEVVKETRLLGVILTDDLKWAANTHSICVKAYKKLWILRRLQLLEVDRSIILDVYCKEVRSVLEVAVPAWHSGLSLKQVAQIERVQRVAVSIIMGESSMTYSQSLKYLGLDTLYSRRNKLCENFAKRTLKSRHRDMFERNTAQYNFRHQEKFKEHRANTKRFYMSPLNFLTRILNSC